MFNWRDSNVTLKRDKEVAAASTVSAEGLLLVKVLESGIEKCAPGAGSSSEVAIGFSMLDNESFTTAVKVESVTIPSSSPYVVLLSHGYINGSGPTSYEIRVQPATGGDYTQANPPAATTQFQVTNATAGEVTFHSSDAGKVVTVTYRYTLLATEVPLVVPGVRSPNNTASALFKHVTVLSGHGEVFTMEFDASKDYSTGTLKSAANGKVTIGGAGADLTAVARVIKLPTVDDPHLGLAINMTC